MAANYEQTRIQDNTSGRASQPSPLSDHGFNGVGSYQQCEAQQYIADYNKLLKQGILPTMDVSGNATVSDGKTTVTEHHDETGRVDKVSERMPAGNTRGYDIDKEGNAHRNDPDPKFPLG
jgi:hypothetical protein